MAGGVQIVDWTENRWLDDGSREEFFVQAEKTEKGWIFSERSTWETVWLAVPPTAMLIRQAEFLLCK